MSAATKNVITFWIMAAVKGGVGKTKMARLLAETCLAHDWRFLTIDTDTGNKHANGLSDIYQGLDLPYVAEDGSIDDEAQATIFKTIMGIIQKNDLRHVIIDLGASEVERFMTMLMNQGLLDEITADGHQIKLVYPIDKSTDSHVGLAELMNKTGPDGIFEHLSITTYVVLDAAVGVSHQLAAARQQLNVLVEKDFPTWATSPLREKARQAGWHEIEIPVLASTSAYTQWMTHNTSLGSPLSISNYAKADLGLDHMRNQRQLTRWLNRVRPELARVMD